MDGRGRALPHRGLSELQPCSITPASSHIPSVRRKTKIRFTLHRIPAGKPRGDYRPNTQTRVTTSPGCPTSGRLCQKVCPDPKHSEGSRTSGDFDLGRKNRTLFLPRRHLLNRCPKKFSYRRSIQLLMLANRNVPDQFTLPRQHLLRIRQQRSAVESQIHMAAISHDVAEPILQRFAGK